jgi:hypothetical protein
LTGSTLSALIRNGFLEEEINGLQADPEIHCEELFIKDQCRSLLNKANKIDGTQLPLCLFAAQLSLTCIGI